MKVSEPILVIEDDIDDQQIMREIFTELQVKNPVLFFNKAMELYEYLSDTTETIFIILCDVNLPGINGIQLRNMIDERPDLRRKSIPFVFYSTTANKDEVNKAYDLTVQGFFEKPANYNQIKSTLNLILDYWRVCIHPNRWK